MARKRDRPVTAWLLRCFLLLNACSAIGFIVYALILQNPPKTALPLGMLIVGCCALVAVLIGLVGSLRVTCCLTLYLYLGGLVTLAELGITLSMFFNYNGTVDALVKYSKENDPDWTKADTTALKDKVANGRWFFLVVCVLQFISMLVALVLRVCVYPRERDFENFEEGGEGTKAASSSQIQMQKLQQSISGRQPQSVSTSPGTSTYASSKLQKSTTQKMSAKYGSYTTDADYTSKKKGWFSRS